MTELKKNVPLDFFSTREYCLGFILTEHLNPVDRVMLLELVVQKKSPSENVSIKYLIVFVIKH